MKFSRTLAILMGAGLGAGYGCWVAVTVIRLQVGTLQDPPPTTFLLCLLLGLVTTTLAYLVWRDRA